MLVLDLFSGLRGWSQAFAERGHDVLTVDNDPRFGADIVADVASLDPRELERIFGHFDVVLASPPCDAFTVMRISANWLKADDGSLVPKSVLAMSGTNLVAATLRLVRELDPTFWVMENPRAALRKLDVVKGLERRTVTYCHYGEARMKPTDLWSDRWDAVPLTLHPACRNGDPCHERAPRGSNTGTQGLKDSAARAKIPYALALDVCLAVEQAVDAQRQEVAG